MYLPEILYDLKVKHSSNQPLFVLGHGRSGTSILIKLIRKYLKINFGTESQFIVRFHDELKKYGDLQRDENARRLIEDLSRERWFKRIHKRFGFRFDARLAFESLQERSYSAILDTIFRQFADYHKMERWGDKTPEYINHLPLLHSLFPDAVYIHIVRDGRDVALSEFRTPFGAKNIYCAARDWRKKTQLIRSFGRNLPAGRFYEIRYEDLLNDSAAVFSELIEFLRIEDDDNTLRSFITAHIEFDLRRDNFFKWKRQLSAGQKHMFERVAGKQLAKYNYLVQHGNLSKPTMPEHCYWVALNFVQRKFKYSYWLDNIYRLSLRFRSLKLHVRSLRLQKTRG